jgi:hypothetical protein
MEQVVPTIRELHVEALKILLRKHKRPYKCYFCKKTITEPPPSNIDSPNIQNEPLNLYVHHKDDHHENLDPDNLAPAHVACHYDRHQVPAGRDSSKKLVRRLAKAAK